MTAQLPNRVAPIIERAPLPTVEVQGPEHILSHVNAAFCALLGQSRESLIGRPFANIVDGGEHCVGILDRVRATGEAATHAVALDADKKGALWVYAMWPALDASERPEGVIIQLVRTTSAQARLVAVNEALLIAGLREHELAEAAAQANAQLKIEVRERALAEKALREIDARKNEFLAMLAHELRNPLAPIRAAAEIIGMSTSADPGIRQAREMITRQVDRMVRLVDDLLDVSLIDRGKARLHLEQIDLAETVASAVEACRDFIASRQHRITMHLQYAPSILLNADRVRVEQIVTNLVVNAAKYTPLGGILHVDAHQEQGMAVVRVRDNGIGIAQNMLRPIFDVFTQVEESLRVQGGLGLGLKLVKDLVAMHGGTVEALSDGPNLGSEFVVRLPAITTETPRVAAPPEGTFASSPSRHVLVVDDGDDNRESMALVLRMVGHSVTTAENGITAVEVALRTLPDAALIDIGLPDLNGYQVAERIRASPRGGRIFLIALTGYGQDEDKQHAISAGFDAHMTKPADLHALDKLLKTLPSAKQA